MIPSSVNIITPIALPICNNQQQQNCHEVLLSPFCMCDWLCCVLAECVILLYLPLTQSRREKERDLYAMIEKRGSLSLSLTDPIVFKSNWYEMSSGRCVRVVQEVVFAELNWKYEMIEDGEKEKTRTLERHDILNRLISPLDFCEFPGHHFWQKRKEREREFAGKSHV